MSVFFAILDPDSKKLERLENFRVISKVDYTKSASPTAGVKRITEPAYVPIFFHGV